MRVKGGLIWESQGVGVFGVAWGHGSVVFCPCFCTDEGVRVEQCRAWESMAMVSWPGSGQGDMEVRGGKRVR